MAFTAYKYQFGFREACDPSAEFKMDMLEAYQAAQADEITFRQKVKSGEITDAEVPIRGVDPATHVTSQMKCDRQMTSRRPSNLPAKEIIMERRPESGESP